MAKVLIVEDDEVIATANDRVRVLDLGADDYVVKPFSMRELVARVRAVARRGVRAQAMTPGEPIESGELLIDPHVSQAYVGGRSAELTPTEFRLLYTLALESGRVVTRDELMQRIWGRPLSPLTSRLATQTERRQSPHS